MSRIYGWVIQAEDETFLSKKLFWFPHERMEDTYVHPESEIDSIRAASANWEKKPTRAYRAHWSEDEGTVIDGAWLMFAAAR